MFAKTFSEIVQNSNFERYDEETFEDFGRTLEIRFRIILESWM